jgi:hypothetical protein
MRLSDIIELKTVKKTQPSTSTSGIDEVVLNEINFLINNQVREYKLIINEINSLNKELYGLIGKEDEESLNRIAEIEVLLEDLINNKNRIENTVVSKQMGTEIIQTILSESSRSLNESNVLGKTLHFSGFKNEPSSKIVPENREENVNIYVQKMVDSNFNMFNYKHLYALKNINPFDNL